MRPPRDTRELDLTFEGFEAEAFEVLARLRSHPHIEQYREEKDAFRACVQEPFKRYRDDLVVNWVLPEQLGFETERNVFSRILKNDFGAGGSHHHLWMAFYRPGLRRVTDLQLAHSIYPDRFTVTLFAAEHMKDVFRTARRRILEAPEHFLGLVNPLLEEEWFFAVTWGSGQARREQAFEAPAASLPADFSSCATFRLRRAFSRDDVLAWGPGLVGRALEAVHALWPVYAFLLGEGVPTARP
jgi:hypothetical protein